MRRRYVWFFAAALILVGLVAVLSTRLRLRITQQRQSRALFHAECVGDTVRVDKGRAFDTLENQFARNGDDTRSVVLKMDVG